VLNVIARPIAQITGVFDILTKQKVSPSNNLVIATPFLFVTEIEAIEIIISRKTTQSYPI